MIQNGAVSSTESGPDGPFREAYRILGAAIADRAFPGCAFGVLADGEVKLKDALGNFTYEDSAPTVQPDTIYDIASVTKVVGTTAGAMLLWQRKKLDIEMRLGDLLPQFIAGRAPEDPARKITLGNLLAHNSGLPGYVEFFRTHTTADSLLAACMNLPVQEEPGTQSEYSDPGFILLGKALEVILGEPLDQFVQREVLEPSKMTETLYCPPAALHAAIPPTEVDLSFRKRLIQGEVQDENAWVLGGVAGHAGLFSNVPDMLRFSSAILHAGAPGELFCKETVDYFAERQPPVGASPALGWDTPSEISSSGQYFSRRSIGHLAYSGCSLWIDLESQIAVVLLTNRTWPDRSSQLIKQVRPVFHDAIRKAL